MQKKPRPQKGDILSVQVQKLSEKGQGVALTEGYSISVPDVLPEEQVQVEIVRSRRNDIRARVLDVEQPIPSRVEPVCAHVDTCGGCSLQHWDYASQVHWREEQLRTLLDTVPGLALPAMDRVTMEEPFGFRSKLELTFGQDGDRVLLGFHRRESFMRIVDVERCWIAPDMMNSVIQVIRQEVQQYGLPAYHPKTHQGFWRFAVIRVTQQGEMMLMLITQSGHEEVMQDLTQRLVAQISTLKSVHWGISEKLADVALPESLQCLYGPECLEDQLGDLKFSIVPTNFVQPNLKLVHKVYDSVLQAAQLTGREVVYDLYSGIGLMSLFLARKARLVYGVESIQDNVDAAKRTAQLNGIQNTIFLCSKVEDVLKEQALFKLGEPPDVVILDPPRMGLHKDVYGPLLQAAPKRIVYLSCNPKSLAQDLGVIFERNPSYRLTSLRWFDFFAHTAHKETLVCLERD